MKHYDLKLRFDESVNNSYCKTLRFFYQPKEGDDHFFSIFFGTILS